ncbi:MAG: hypothetical protein K6G83_06545 [Lachnospiraceae bacterium]|nr:hypothetical protein [Lachnospiraceae bacterium]
MEFELWLFAVKNLAQTYEMSQVIFAQLPEAEKKALRAEYEKTVSGGEKKEDKTLKKLEGLIYDLHNSMNVAERFVERHHPRYMEKYFEIEEGNVEQEFALRMFTELKLMTMKVMMAVTYLSRPVTDEGELSLNAEGKFILGSHEIVPGMLLEFFYHGRWEFGKVHRAPDAPYDYYLTGLHNEEFHINLNGLKVRVRG